MTVEFSEAVTVTGTPRMVLVIGEQRRYAYYSGEGLRATDQTFSYTVLVSDHADRGISVSIDRDTLDGGTIRATDDSADAKFNPSTFSLGSNHKVNTEILLVANLEQDLRTDTITVSATQSAEILVSMPTATRGATINSVTLDVATPSKTLDVTVRVGVDDPVLKYTGSVTSAGLRKFTLSSPSRAMYGSVIKGPAGAMEFSVVVEGSGTGSIELKATSTLLVDTDSVTGWSITSEQGGTLPVPKLR